MQHTSMTPQPFFSTPTQRLALARQRYFDEGTRPSGLVSEGVIQSWSRCVQAHRDPSERVQPGHAEPHPLRAGAQHQLAARRGG
jgi:transcriptional regulator of acetoin/glycerol metabolism